MARRTGQDPRRPLIGVTGNARRWSPSWWCIRLAVALAGGHAVRISVEDDTDAGALQGVIISGGDDIHPSLYGKQGQPKARYDRARDALEIRYIEHALKARLPLFGICRGYQLINVVCGGTLHADIRPLRTHTSNRSTILPRKTIFVDRATQLHEALQATRLLANSLHHQALEKVASNLQTVARDEDEFVQGVEASSDEVILGVQWHPEYLSYQSRQRRLFKWLVDAARSDSR